MNLANKLVLITGGSSGIGKQLAADLLRAGCRVIIASERADRLAQAQTELLAISPHIYAIECDIGQTASVLQMQTTVLQHYGCPDILVNNAGFATYRTFEASSIEEVERLVDVNLVGAMRCTKAFLPDMIKRRSGIIVNMASIAGRLVMTPNGVYCTSKQGLVAWSETMKWELGHFGLQVNVICPGRVEIDTAFFEHETFQNRTKRAETRYTITVKDVSQATIRAIVRNRFITYAPRTLGLVAWGLDAFPFPLKPVYSWLMRNRIKTYYQTRAPAAVTAEQKKR